MHFYKVSLPKSEFWQDESESWMESSAFKSRLNEGFTSRSQGYSDEDDIIGDTPVSFHNDQILVDNRGIEEV
jgi:hypothetical protein